jgi:hypothetical protein
LAATIRYASDLRPPVIFGSALYRREAIGYRQLQFEIAEPQRETCPRDKSAWVKPMEGSRRFI